MRTDFDVAIVGGGIAGASLGAELSAHQKVVLIEAEDQCGYHSTGRSAAFWLESYGGPVVARLTRESRDFLESPPPDFSADGFLAQRGAVHIGEKDWAELPDSVATCRIDRSELQRLVPGIAPRWRFATLEPGCADIDVASLHAAYLGKLRGAGGDIRCGSELKEARYENEGWSLLLSDGSSLKAQILVNAAGAWADDVAARCGIEPIGIVPYRRTMVQLRMGRSGLRALPLVSDSEGRFYFKGESDNRLWLSPHDEHACDPCDCAPEEIDIAIAIDRLQSVVDWPIEAVERSWAGLRSFASDRLPVYGFDPTAPAFFWCAGQGGFGIQTAPAAARMAAGDLLGLPADSSVDPAPFRPERLRTG